MYIFTGILCLNLFQLYAATFQILLPKITPTVLLYFIISMSLFYSFVLC